MARHARRAAQPRDDEAGDSCGRLDTDTQSVIAQERDPWARAGFQVALTTIAADAVVVVDESSTAMHCTPRYARAPRGQRADGVGPHHTPPTTPLMASLSRTGIGPSLVVAGATDPPAFVPYIERILAPALRPGQIVVLDNRSAQQPVRMRTALAARGCRWWWLPTYSPVRSPIERAFATIKASLRQTGARTRTASETAIACALDTMTAADAQAFFHQCGYRRRPNRDQLLSTLLYKV